MMFSPREHEAVRRLLDQSTGYMPACRRISHWLQQWDSAKDKSALPRRVAGLSESQANDVLVVADAARRERVGPSDLGRPEYVHKLVFAARAHPLAPDHDRA